jgi:hypothetical protein
MLSARSLVNRDGVVLADIACRHAAGRGGAGELTPGFAIVFVRRGCFVRHADGLKAELDPTLAYCVNPGEEQRYDHPHSRGDDCTAVSLEASVVASLWGGEPGCHPLRYASCPRSILSTGCCSPAPAAVGTPTRFSSGRWR